MAKHKGKVLKEPKFDQKEVIKNESFHVRLVVSDFVMVYYISKTCGKINIITEDLKCSLAAFHFVGII